jgi:signal transduction histidine kinase
MQVLVNFLSNALKFSPANSKIEVKLDLLEIQDLKKTVITNRPSRPSRLHSSQLVSH